MDFETQFKLHAAHPLDNRYSEKMREIFALKRWYKYNWGVEAGLARAQARMGIIPQLYADVITKAVDYAKPEAVLIYEAEKFHDLMAMVLALVDACEEVDPAHGKEAGGKVHLLATSYDIEDPAQVLRILDAYKIVKEEAIEFKDNLIEAALTYRDLSCIGRTHGQQAVTITFGFKNANYASDVQKQIDNLDFQISRIKGKFSGAVGAYNASRVIKTASGEIVDGRVLEQLVGEELGIPMEPISTQIVGRAPYADMLSALATLGESVEKYALEIRELSRQEILEVREGTTKKQVGSSTMVHKKNPINSENICSLVRLLRANTIVAHENIALMHERDLTNSGNERAIIYENFAYLDEILIRAKKVIKNLDIYPENMLRNIYTTRGLVMGEAVMTMLANRGMSRQEAHEKLRVATRQAEDDKVHFIDKLKTMDDVTNLISPEEFKNLKKPENYTGYASEQCIDMAVVLWGPEKTADFLKELEKSKE